MNPGPRTAQTLSLVFLLFGLAGTGCSTVEYLWQAGRGQLSILNRARPLDEVIRDETTPPRIRELLLEVPKVKSFGERMGMKPTSNYEEYVRLDRDAVVYVVSACHPLRFEPKEWKFPIVGGFPYLGWYTREGADQHASRLRKEELDVDVRGAPAYSTLGWFNDPILSTMILDDSRALGELVDVVLHESLHATAYVNHQAFFNESLASFVAEGLTPLYLRETRGVDSSEEKAYRAGLVRQKEYGAKMHAAYEELDTIYKSAATDAEKLEKKTAVLARLRTELRWRADRDLNNATLLGFREYEGNRDLFSKMFARCGSDWPRFLRGVTKVREKDFGARQTKDLASLEAAFRCD